jgi:hypothetical protein
VTAQPETQPSIAPTATTEPVIAAEPPPPVEVPAGWSTVTLAFSPSGRTMRVLETTGVEKTEDEPPFDPVQAIQDWRKAYDQDLMRDAEPIIDRMSENDLMWVYSSALFRKGRVIHTNAFHTRLCGLFTTDGAWGAENRVRSMVITEVSDPMTAFLLKELKPFLPAVPARRAKSENSQEAVPAPE